MTEQVKKNKPHYPTEPFVMTYERHVEKWGEIINTKSQERFSTWSNTIHRKWSLFRTTEYIWLELWDTPPFNRSKYSKWDHSRLLQEVRNDDLIRSEVQELLFRSYVQKIENDIDLRLVKIYDRDLERHKIIEVKFKEILVDEIQNIDRHNNNPFDILWYMGTIEYRIRKYVLVTRDIVILIVIVSLLIWMMGLNEDPHIP